MARASGVRALIHDDRAAALAALMTEHDAAGDEPFGRIELDLDGFVLASVGHAAATDIAPAPELAFVLHTSASTGPTQAIEISWQAEDVFVSRWSAFFELTDKDRILRTAELSFELACFAHLAAWRCGAVLCTVQRPELSVARSVAAAFVRLSPTVVCDVPALFMKLCAGLDGERELPPSLRVIGFSGEVFPPQALLDLSRRAPHARLFHFFGPTETNACTFHEVERRGDGTLSFREPLSCGEPPSCGEPLSFREPTVK